MAGRGGGARARARLLHEDSRVTERPSTWLGHWRGPRAGGGHRVLDAGGWRPSLVGSTRGGGGLGAHNSASLQQEVVDSDDVQRAGEGGGRAGDGGDAQGREKTDLSECDGSGRWARSSAQFCAKSLNFHCPVVGRQKLT
jgi:hypothetical protein